MEPELLKVLQLAEEYPALAKQHVLDEVRLVAAQRLWHRLTEAQRAYACGLVHGGLPSNLDWSAMTRESRTILATGVLRWATAFLPATPSNPKPTATPAQAEPGPTPVGC